MRAAKHGRERLHCDSRDVVHGLLCGKRYACGLGVEAHEPGALVPRAKAVFHHAIPDFSRGAILRDLFEKIVVRVKEEAQAGTEFIYFQAAAARPFHVLDTVVQGERELLQSGRSRLADMISADRDGVEPWRVLRTELEGIDHQPHGRRRRIDVFLLRDVFLENIVLNGAGNFLPVRALLLGDDQIHRP